MPPMTDEERRAELRNRFEYHPATEQTGPLHDDVRAHCRDLALFLDDVLPDGRHKSMALTAVQEAMWAANAAVACDTPRADTATAD